MPIPLDEVKAKGQPYTGGFGKKIDPEELKAMLSEYGYTIDELAEHFGAAKPTVRRVLKKIGAVPYKDPEDGKIYWIIE